MTEKFNNWNTLKQKLENRKLISYKQGEIYFMSVGKNIGHEVYGKDELFLRPVLVYRKLSKQTFIGIPLSSKEKNGTYFFNFRYTKKTQSTALLNQIRVFDIRRHAYLDGHITISNLKGLEEKLLNLLKVTSPKGKFGHSRDELSKCTKIITDKKLFVKNTTKNILITGGAGYIGSHVVKQFLETTNHHITIVDNFKTGFENTIKTLKSFANVDFINQDLAKWDEVDAIFKENSFDVVIHFAASLLVGESVTNPLKYYMNNTCNSANIINQCNKYKVNKFIFSSTAAVYGEPSIDKMPLSENELLSPINPYGSSKLFTEQIIKDNAKANKDFKYVILRYFNVAGAEESLSIGECHEPETHLIPLVVKTALGKRDKIMIFGEDYETDDGTCIRDYIHVDDLASAHLSALEYLDTNESNIFNCGYGHGFSVKEVIDTVKKVSGIDFKVEVTSRRDGDPAILVADNSKILNLTSWKPKHDNLEFICKTALEWERKLHF